MKLGQSCLFHEITTESSSALAHVGITLPPLSRRLVAAGTPPVPGSACAVSPASQGSVRISPSGPYKANLILTTGKMRNLG